MRFGVDTGGTFTDIVARDAGGRLSVHKLLSTPDDPSVAISDGVRFLQPEGLGDVVHGTTVATNALLERRGCQVAFVTTRGFADLLALRRQNRPELYALNVQVPPTLAALTIVVNERMAADGTVLEPLESDLGAESFAACDAVAICLLHSYANDAHEQVLAAQLRSTFSGHVSVSSELVPEFREFERASTTVVNAYVGPIVADYISRLAERLPDASIEVMQSSGGRASLEEVAHAPVHTVLSGPAGGVVGAFAAAGEAGFDDIITFDMGGTSTDVSLCAGEVSLTHEATIDGHPLRVPTLDILTVGAGGGSIAWVDDGGALRVGPRSAGADPGPAAYGRGGVSPTVTDAHVVLGSLRADRFLGGTMALDIEASRRAVSDLATSIGLGIAETARGILAVADATMARAVNVICSRRGHDPRDFALVAFGGAGGLHACRLASALGMTTVILPSNPGVLSAAGMLHAPRARFLSESVLEPLSAEVVIAAAAALRTRAEAQQWSDRTDELSVALRYRGQSYDIQLPMQPIEELRLAFDARHEALYGYRDRARDVEVVAVRLRSSEASEDQVTASTPVRAAPDLERLSIDLGEGLKPTAVLSRYSVDEIAGPAVLTEYSGTTVIPEGWSGAHVSGHLVIRRAS